jgi:maleate cis-trans isomerase
LGDGMSTQGEPNAGPLRVGLLVPVNNTTMEVELPAWLPAGSSVTTVKIPRGPGLLTPETIPAYRDSAIALARRHFAGGDHDLIAYGCTAAGFLSGPAGDAELSAMLTQATGLPVVTVARAMVRALQHERANGIAVVTPYLDAVNAQLEAFLNDGGISVARLDTFRAPDVIALGRITADEVRDLARATMGADCDALFIGCAQLPTHAILAGLQAEFGRPAWSSIRATAWDAAAASAHLEHQGAKNIRAFTPVFAGYAVPALMSSTRFLGRAEIAGAADTGEAP